MQDLWGKPAPQVINKFKGEYDFLSNFYLYPVVWAGVEYPSNEHAYVAAKTLDMALRYQVQRTKTPGAAKRLGRSFKLRPGWDNKRLKVMEKLIARKFKRDSFLAGMLLKTGDAELIEGNFWGDYFWGVCRGVGENHLGKLLMKQRAELREPAKRRSKR